MIGHDQPLLTSIKHDETSVNMIKQYKTTIKSINHYSNMMNLIINHYQPSVQIIYEPLLQPLTMIHHYRSSAYLQHPSPCLVPLEILLAVARLVLSPICWHLRGCRRQQISSQLVIQSQQKNMGKAWEDV